MGKAAGIGSIWTGEGKAEPTNALYTLEEVALLSDAPGGKLAPVSGGHLCTASEPANNVTVPYGVRTRDPIPESLQTES